MEFLAVVEQGALANPALLPLVLVALALTLWACEHKRWLWATTTCILGCAACFIYIVSPASASARPADTVLQAGVASIGAVQALPGRSGNSTHALLDPGRFSSSVRLHPRFPRDFPIPRSFRLESNSGGARSGNLTVRFRFIGEANNAVCDLREQGRADGWAVEVLAPHRMTFHKDGRVIEAWFSYPAHSVVLDIPDLQ
jgi:hypothetical protein